MLKHITSIWNRVNRNNINRAIDVLNQLGVRVQDLVAEGQLTPSQYTELIQTVNGLIAKGEVKLDDLSPEILEAINNGDGTPFEILSIPRDRSVTPEKTTFVFKSTNLLDVDSLEKDKFLSEVSGLPRDSSGMAISDFIEVGHFTNFAIRHILQVARYDADKNFISLTYPSDTSSTTPAGAEYIRVTVRIANFDTAQINEGSDLLPYEPYYFKLDDRISGGNDFLDALTEENEDWVI